MIRLTAFALVATLAAGTSWAAQPYKAGDPHVSRAQLAEHGPVKMKVNNRVSVRILSVGIAGKPGRNCKLSLPGLRKILRDRVASGAELGAGITVKIHLLPEKSRDGELICTNEGEGCIAEVEVDI